MRTSSIIRTGSIPVQKPLLPGSPRVSLSRQASLAGAADKNHAQSPRLSLHTPASGIKRALSDGSLIRSESENFGLRRNLNRTGTPSFPAIILDDEEFLSDDEDGTALRRPESRIPVMDVGSGGGAGYGGDYWTDAVTGGNGGERIKIGAYYEEMLKSNPTDALLLRNYGKFLHQVENDTAKAEEYYGRAILADPGDGELLSLYGKLIWETERDQERAQCYFNQAIHAAPDDCTVLGSYAHFMWESGEEAEEEVNGGGMKGKAEESAAAELIAAC